MSKINQIYYLVDKLFENEGDGWRLALDKSKAFSVLIGNNQSATEISRYEWSVLVPLVFEIKEQLDSAKLSLIDEEKISIEIERDIWWAHVEGDKNEWNLSVILTYQDQSKRGIEMSWQYPSSESLLIGMRLMWDSYQ